MHTALALAFLLSTAPQSPAGTYGKGVTEAQAVKLDELMAHPEKYLGKKVRVQGVVADVCPRAGCWFKVGESPRKTITFKVKDGEMVFPVSAKGHKADAEGVFTRAEVGEGEEHEHEGASCDADKAAQKQQPAAKKVVYLLEGTGAVIQ